MSRTVGIYKNMNSQEGFQVPLESVLKKIRDGYWKTTIATVEKENLPCFTVSGVFAGAKKQENLIKKSLVISLDIDDISDFQEVFIILNKIKQHTISCFKSRSGKGLCVLVAIDDFVDVADYKEIYGALYDEVTDLNKFAKFDHLNNLNRLRYVSSDPDLYMNLEAIPFTERKEIPLNLPLKKDGVVSTVSLDVNKLTGLDRVNSVVEKYTEINGPFGANGKPRHDWVLGLTRWLCRADVSETDAYSYIVSNYHNPARAEIWDREVARCVRDSYNTYAAERGDYVPAKPFNFNEITGAPNIEVVRNLFLQFIAKEEENGSKVSDEKLCSFIESKINFLKSIYRWL